MLYLTYEKYKEIGGEQSETAFNKNINRACGVIDNFTAGRIEKMKEMCLLVDELVINDYSSKYSLSENLKEIYKSCEKYDFSKKK